MKTAGVITFSSIAQFNKAASFIETLRYKKDLPRSTREKNRILLRSLAFRFLLKTYFGKGRFHWKSSYRIYERGLQLLNEYPKPDLLSAFQEEKYIPSFGELRSVTPVERLEELRAQSGNASDLLEAKREALLCFISDRFERLVAGRKPNYRETFDPNTPQSKELPRTASRKLMQHVIRPALEILETHRPHCPAEVWKTINNIVLSPPLPFGIELPA